MDEYKCFITSNRRIKGLFDIKQKFKTVICNNWLGGHCEFGDKCKFAHGSEEIREFPSKTKLKTIQCKQFHEKGFCKYGNNCQFIHRDTSEETASSSPQQNENPNVKMNYRNASNELPLAELKPSSFIMSKKRLPVFLSISSKDF